MMIEASHDVIDAGRARASPTASVQRVPPALGV
jgi:hypothetical protein